MISEGNLGQMVRKLNELEATIMVDEMDEIDEMNETNEVEREGFEFTPTPLIEQNEYNRNFRKFVHRNFYEIESLVMEWVGFKKSKKEYMRYIDKTLDKCVHGHLESKQQIKRLVGQMMNSRKKKGFCLGLQGPPGV